MRLFRLLSRLILLSLAAAAFAGLTEFYGSSVPPSLPYLRYREMHGHRPASPRGSQFLEFVRAGVEFAVFAVGGRIALRLRLSPTSRSEGQPILLGLNPARQDRQDPEVGA
jgi:hypothetical protein